MFPYVEQPALRLGGTVVTAFQILVFAGVVTGYQIVVGRAEKRGWDRDLVLTLTLWTAFLGFVGSHTFDVALYHPDEVRQNPLVLLEVWGTMSSFGGLIGGIAGGLIVLRWKRVPWAKAYEFFDIVAYAFTFAWIFGRMGCALAHDHIGIPSNSFLAVRFPGQPMYDLGLLEFLYTLVLAALFYWLDRRPRPTGFYIAAFSALYGPVRFVLDTLRTGDARYLGWTPGQYASLGVTLFGVWLSLRLARSASRDKSAA